MHERRVVIFAFSSLYWCLAFRVDIIADLQPIAAWQVASATLKTAGTDLVPGVNTRKYVYIMSVEGLPMTAKSKPRGKRRRGKPFMVYLTHEQSAQLKAIAHDRHVSRAVVVRFAIDQLLKQLSSGQLELPLGLG